MPTATSTKTKQIPVVVVDDEKSICSSCRKILDRSDRFHCVGAFNSGPTALAEIPKIRPAAVLLDIKMPGINGIECARRLKAMLPELKVVMITGLADAETMHQSLHSLVDGYLTKPFEVKDCLEALKVALGGGMLMVAKMTHGLDNKDDENVHCGILDQRDQEVLRLLRNGLTYQEIATVMQLSFDFVRILIHRMYVRLDVNNSREALEKWQQISRHTKSDPEESL